MKRCVYCDRPPAYWRKKCSGPMHRFPLSAFEKQILQKKGGQMAKLEADDSQYIRAQQAVGRTRHAAFRGDGRPASTFGQERLTIAVAAVAECALALIEELRFQRLGGGDDQTTPPQ